MPGAVLHETLLQQTDSLYDIACYIYASKDHIINLEYYVYHYNNVIISI